MFRIFPFKFGGGEGFNLNQLWQVTSGVYGIIYSILDNINIDEIKKEYEDTSSNISQTEENDNFIELKQDEDMYVLIIDLMGIDLRELSIRYDPGIIEINLNRSEIENRIVGGFSSKIVVKKGYNKKFQDIEEIDTNRLMKTIDDGILKIRMPKKYVVNEFCNIVDVENYIENEK